MEDAKELAVKAVAEGDGTLKKANFTYHTLSGFKNQVDESKQKAADALESVPSIKRQIDNAIELIANSEAVSTKNKTLSKNHVNFSCRQKNIHSIA